MAEKLRIGKIAYSNLFPIFHVLQRECDCRGYEFVEGYPSALNRMLREGAVDISPSSSVEYLRREGEYYYLEGHSISSRGPVGSILLFSRVPIESLDGSEVFVTHQSESSVALLRIILRKFHSVSCTLTATSSPVEKALATHPAYMAIGDEALLAVRNARAVELDAGEPACRLLSIGLQPFYVYDLGALWREKTGLPFVFALWIGRKGAPPEKRALLEKFREDLDRAGALAKRLLPEIANEPGLVLPPPEMLAYWRGIVYDFDEECKKGLGLFKKYLEEPGML
jgi:chorismate dehydratase